MFKLDFKKEIYSLARLQADKVGHKGPGESGNCTKGTKIFSPKKSGPYEK